MLRPRNLDASSRSLATGIAFFAFLLVDKVWLLCWERTAKHIHPLGDIAPGRRWMVAGYDAGVSFGVAVCYFVLLKLSQRSRRLRWLLAVALPAILYAGLILFTILSLHVTQIYGEPLDIEKIRSADDLMIMRASLAAYVGPMTILLLVAGLVCPTLLGRPLARWLANRREPRRDARLWCGAFGLVAVLCLAQAVGLKGIDTVGVKDDALVFFIKTYRPKTRPVDLPRLEAELERRIAGRENLVMRPSLFASGKTMPRDFPWSRTAAGFNVVMIQMESTSAVHINQRSAPNIMALARHGLRFANHLTTFTYTPRSSYSIYYSDYMPSFDNSPSRIYGQSMPQPAFAEVLKAAGYQTALFDSSFLDYADFRFLFIDKGMDTLVGAREIVGRGGSLFRAGGVSEFLTINALSAWIKSHEREKFLAAYLTLSPHHPYDFPAEDAVFPGDTWLDRYQNSLHYADRAVGRLVAFLRSEGLLDKTLIVIFGDHGETVSTYPVGHGLKISGEELFTPFLISNPVLFPQPLTSQLPSNHLDIAPVVVAALGLTAPGDWLGRNLLADRIPVRQQYVNVFHIHNVVVRDGALLYAWDQQRETSRLFELKGYELLPLEPQDRRVRLLQDYRAQAELFNDWNTERHLKRAMDPQLATAPTELLHEIVPARPDQR